MPKISDKVEKVIPETNDVIGIDDGVSGITKKIKVGSILKLDHLESVGLNNLIQRSNNNTNPGVGTFIFIQGEDNAAISGKHQTYNGKNNQMNGDYSSANGQSNLTDGNHVRVHGKLCDSAGDYTDTQGYGCSNEGTGARVSGASGHSKNYAEDARAGGHFKSLGDAQYSTVLFRGVVPFSTPTEIFLDGSAVRFDIPDQRIISMTIKLTGWLNDEAPNPEIKPTVYQVWDFLGRKITTYAKDVLTKDREIVSGGMALPGLDVDVSFGDFRFMVTNNDNQGSLRVIMKCEVHYIGVETIVGGGGGGFDDPIGPPPPVL